MAYAAEGFTKGFLGTIQGLTALERAQLEAEEARERRTRERETRAAAAETLGRVGQAQEVALSGLTPASAQQKLLAEQTGGMAGEGISAEDIARRNVEAAQYATRQGVPARDLTGTYSEAQAYQDYSRRLAGIDPEKSMTARVQGMQLEEITRKADKEKKITSLQTELTNNLARISGTAESNGMQGLAEEAKKAGLNVEFVPGKDGVGGRINVRGPKGDVLETISNVNDAVTKLESLVMQDFQTRMVPLLGADGFMSYMQQQQANMMKNRELALNERRDARDAELQPVRIRQLEAAIEESKAKAAKAGYETGKLKRMDDMNAELQNLLKDPVKNADAIRSMAAQMEALFPEVYVKTGKITRDGEEVLGTVGILNPTTDKILRGAGVAPPEIVAAARSGTNPITGKPYTSAEITAFENKYPNTPWPGPQKTTTPAKGARSAIPATSAPTSATGGRGAPPSATPNIPPAPPRTIQQQTRGGIVDTGVPNPAYAAWERRYGQYQAQQR